MTLTLQLETWTKVHANLLPIGTLLVKYEPDWAKERGEKIFPRQVISDGQKEGQIDGQTDHYMVPAEQGPRNLCMET